MRTLRSRQVQGAILVVAALAVVWLLVVFVQGGASTGGAGASPAGPAGARAVRTLVTDPASGLPWIDESALPPEARETLALIRAGGPFPYPRNDGVTFANREGLLPREQRGYYREYTVQTPGSPDRGPRRIITGSGGETYWTADHYASFSRIREGS
ncbi:ribonuclease [Intrasporangium oryzae NRRL B-24470]|uniref:Ribonuclease n=1 Tax=Intrasporangium oryzae NRRL B-24470 TaxID=1386089 RepID=W9G5M7_9MICO|nr:ribonuclease domain-containing protein [Intrasporangium oryzae]EWT01466.1 ribonuclease [Intrasporangium oryzae NRRL B-24470]